ncbi:hypothetical protein [Methylobacterium durans]|uniref:hypothetical protein n=1 Tax=Methylobacterium durans TaxID=2202825 RepID=UPI001F21E968|nr:hypothetical protein [Methylobacterium durans]
MSGKAAEPAAREKSTVRAAEAPPARAAGTGRKAVRAAAAPARHPVRTVRAHPHGRVAVRTFRQSPAPSRTARVVRATPYTASPYAATPARYPYAVAGPVPAGYGYGYTVPDERLRRIREAQTAGYIVLRQRSVVFPDGRSLRTYRPYEGDDDGE